MELACSVSAATPQTGWISFLAFGTGNRRRESRYNDSFE
jgi:hypothetical protein